MLRRLTPLLLAALLLGGCSGMRLVESQVRATVPTNTPAIEPGAHYRFERLPSQQNQAETDSIEIIAEAELNEVGLVHDDKDARYSVLVSTRMEPYYADDWGRPYPYGPYGPYSRFNGAFVIGNSFYGSGFGLGMRFPPPQHYRHQVTVLIRNLQNTQVVYETTAAHSGPWNDRYNILRAVLAAALKDFPTPPAGLRSVKVEIPR